MSPNIQEESASKLSLDADDLSDLDAAIARHEAYKAQGQGAQIDLDPGAAARIAEERRRDEAFLRDELDKEMPRIRRERAENGLEPFVPVDGVAPLAPDNYRRIGNWIIATRKAKIDTFRNTPGADGKTPKQKDAHRAGPGRAKRNADQRELYAAMVEANEGREVRPYEHVPAPDKPAHQRELGRKRAAKWRQNLSPAELDALRAKKAEAERKRRAAAKVAP